MSEVSGRELAEFSLPNIDHCLVDAGSGSLISHRGQNQSDYIIVRIYRMEGVWVWSVTARGIR